MNMIDYIRSLVLSLLPRPRSHAQAVDEVRRLVEGLTKQASKVEDKADRLENAAHAILDDVYIKRVEAEYSRDIGFRLWNAVEDFDNTNN